MGHTAFETPVSDSVEKINNEVAVGEDLDFQRRWWRFENIIWTFFGLILICDVAGLFGRGPLANASMANQALTVKYERVERYSTPSTITVTFSPSAIQDGKYHLFISDSLVEKLGLERVSPQPESTTLADGGLSYTFPVNGAAPGIARFELQPSKPGIFHFSVNMPGTSALQARVVVMP